MQLLLRSCERTFTVTLENDAHVSDLKAAVEDVEVIPASDLSLSVGSKALTTGLLSSLVGEDEVIAVNLDVAGGMRAKWRKKRMRRLRRKRRKMRQRAR